VFTLYIGTSALQMSTPDNLPHEAMESAGQAPAQLSAVEDPTKTNVPEDSEPGQMQFKRMETNASVMHGVNQRITSLGMPEILKGVQQSLFSWASSPSNDDTSNPKCDISFRWLSAWMSFLMTLLACGSMFVVLEVTINEQRTVHENHLRYIPSHVLYDMQKELEEKAWYSRLVAIVVTAVASVLSFVSGCLFGKTVSRPIKRIKALMKRVGGSEDIMCSHFTIGKPTRGSRISEFNQLNSDVQQLMQGMEIFARYIPETVVRSILRGDESAMRLHVSKREVTIMFSDIRDFTTISESLRQEDLMFVLTRYLSIMTRIVAAYEGVVAEILGDGLLVYWNSPDDVNDHASKACAAALAQHFALQPLNTELKKFHLPNIAIRIGIHTGQVLSGNMGSDVKMKFGCMGDPVNLASRLEGLCKVYGVGTLCSSDTYSSLLESAFLCRELDLVRVKGKKDPTRIYEVMGIRREEEVVEHFKSEHSEVSLGGQKGADTQFMHLQGTATNAIGQSLRAMRTFEGLDYNPIHDPSSFQCSSTSKTLGSEELNAHGYVRQLSKKSMRSVRSSFSGTAQPISDMLIDGCSEKDLEDMEAKASLYEEALAAFQGAKFHDAYVGTERLLERWPDDGPAKNLVKKIKQNYDPVANEVIGLSSVELQDWKGIDVMYEK